MKFMPVYAHYQVFVHFQYNQPNAAGRLQAMHSLGLQAPWVDLAKRFFTAKVAQLLEETRKQSGALWDENGRVIPSDEQNAHAELSM